MLKRMEVHFTPEREARLSQIATNAGTHAERLVKNAALRLLEDEAGLRTDVLPNNGELPLWHLGRVGPPSPPRHLRRCPLSLASLIRTFSFTHWMTRRSMGLRARCSKPVAPPRSFFTLLRK